MKSKSSYVFSAALASAALSGISAIPGVSHASDAKGAILAAFTFESTQSPFSVSGTGSGAGTNSTSTFLQYASYAGASVGPLTADSGTGSAYGVHASASTVYSAPAGNGSQKAFSANNYAVGDFFEFQVPTLGTLSDLMLSFDQVRSGTGPTVFSLQYGSSVGTGTTGDTVLGTIATYNVVSTPSFAVGSSSTAVSFGFDLSSISDQLALLPTAFFRLVVSTANASGGTSRIDNFVVATVPEPTAMALSLVAAGGLIRRRRQA